MWRPLSGIRTFTGCPTCNQNLSGFVWSGDRCSNSQEQDYLTRIHTPHGRCAPCCHSSERSWKDTQWGKNWPQAWQSQQWRTACRGRQQLEPPLPAPPLSSALKPGSAPTQDTAACTSPRSGRTRRGWHSGWDRMECGTRRTAARVIWV